MSNRSKIRQWKPVREDESGRKACKGVKGGQAKNQKRRKPRFRVKKKKEMRATAVEEVKEKEAKEQLSRPSTSYQSEKEAVTTEPVRSTDAYIDEGPLPPGWSEYKNDDGIPYYHHPEHGSVWERPKGDGAGEDDEIAEGRRLKSESERAEDLEEKLIQSGDPFDREDDDDNDDRENLPEGWTKHVTKSGKAYYDYDDGEMTIRSWSRPTKAPTKETRREVESAGDAAPANSSSSRQLGTTSNHNQNHQESSGRRDKTRNAGGRDSSRDAVPVLDARRGGAQPYRPPGRRNERGSGSRDSGRTRGGSPPARIARGPTQQEESSKPKKKRFERPDFKQIDQRRGASSSSSSRTPSGSPVDPEKRIPGLRINSFLPEIVDLVSKNPIVGIVAPTGTGKTAGVPPTLALGFKTTIWVTVPTRSATKIWEWVSGHYRELRFGMAANSVRTYTRETDVVYMTTGHMYLKLLSIMRRLRYKAKQMRKEGKDPAADLEKPATLPGILMVDETHHPSTENYALLKLLKYMREEFPQTVPKLVVSSATFGVEAFVKDFPIAKMITIPVESYDVAIRYLPSPVTQKKEILGRAADAAHEIASSIVRKRDSGVIIVFCSGKAEVEQVCEFAESRARRGVSVMPLYSSLPAAEIDEALTEVKDGGVRIVVATNLAESSITIPNTKAVVSTMYHKEVQLGLNERQLLKEVTISQASADQQKGRTGRTCPGICYRMCTEREFKALDKFDSSEIHRSDLYRVVLDFVSACFSPHEISRILELPMERVHTGVSRLVALGMLEKSEGRAALLNADAKQQKGTSEYDLLTFKVTEMGEFVSAFPVIPEMGCVLYFAPNDPGLLRLLLICVAYAETANGGSFFWFPRREFDESPKAYELRKRDIKRDFHEQFRGASDLGCYVRIHEYCELDVAEAVYRGTSYVTKRQAYIEWSNRNYMNNKTLQAARALLRNMERTCQDMGMEVASQLPEKIPPGWWDDVHFLFTRSFSHCLLRLEGKKYYTIETAMSKREGPVQVGKRDSLTTIKNNPPRVVALHLIAYETQGTNRQVFAGGILLPTEPCNDDLYDEMVRLVEEDKHEGLMHAFGLIKHEPPSSRKKKNGGGGGGGGGGLCKDCGGDCPLSCPNRMCAVCCARFSNGRCRAHTKSRSKKNKSKKKKRGGGGGGGGRRGPRRPKQVFRKTAWD
eukprot:jgi/Bigna1/130896/aug1.12_g5604